MELRQLRYFIAAAEEENFNKAARRLNLAQPALSRQMRALEEEIGFSLFLRASKRVHLTPAGRTFLEECRPLLQGLVAAQRRAREVALGLPRQLTVGINPAVQLSASIMNAMTQFRRAQPDLALELVSMTSAEQEAALLDQRIDVGMLHIVDASSSLDAIRLCDGELVLAVNAAHPLAHVAEIGTADLRDEPFLWAREENVTFVQQKVLEAFRRQGFAPLIAQRVSNLETTLSLVSVGAGLALMHSLAAERPQPNVVFRRLSDFDLPLPVILAFRAQTINPQVPLFVAAMRDHVTGASAGSAPDA